MNPEEEEYSGPNNELQGIVDHMERSTYDSDLDEFDMFDGQINYADYGD